MAFTEEYEAFIKTVYLYKGYGTQTLMTEYPPYGREKSGLYELFTKLRRTGTSKAVTTIAIRLRYDYDTMIPRRIRLRRK